MRRCVLVTQCGRCKVMNIRRLWPINYRHSVEKNLGATRALATEVGPRGIRVNAIAPGWIDTDMIAPIKPLLGGIVAQTPLLRLGTPDDIAWVAVFLASDEAKFMTGQVVAANGGFYMSQ